MIKRRHKRLIARQLREAPAVVLFGPRQVGEATLARSMATELPDSAYLDFEAQRDLAKLADPALYLDAYR